MDSSPKKELRYPTENGISYINQYGSVRLDPVGPFMPIRDIPRSIDLPDELAISIGQAGQLVLITENRYMQLVFPFPIPNNHHVRCHVLLHASPRIAAVASVTLNSNITEEDARESLNRLSSNLLAGFQL